MAAPIPSKPRGVGSQGFPREPKRPQGMGKESDRAMLRQGLWRLCEALKGLDRPLRAYAGPGGLVRPSRAPVKGHTTALRAVAAEKRKTFSLYRGTQAAFALEKPFRCIVGRRESRPRFRDPLNLGLDSLWPFGRLEITTGRPYKALKGLEGLSLAH